MAILDYFGPYFGHVLIFFNTFAVGISSIRARADYNIMHIFYIVILCINNVSQVEGDECDLAITNIY